jgi:hypothetical protein
LEIVYFGLIILGLICESFAIYSISKNGSTRLPIIWKPLLFLFISGFITDSLSLVLIFFNSANFPLLYFYGLFEIICFYFIFRNLSTTKYQKQILSLILAIQFLLLICEFIQSSGLLNNFYSNVLNKIVFIVFSIIYAYEEYKSIVSINYSLATFIVLLVLCFYSLSIFYYSLFEEVIKLEPSVYNVLWPIPVVSTILLNSIIGWTLWRRGN